MCLSELVGIDSCEGNAIVSLSDVGLYTNELNAFVGKEYQSGVLLGEDKIRYASELVYNDILLSFTDKYIVKEVMSNKTVGFYQHNLEEKTNRGDLAGLEILLDCHNTWLDLYISDLSLHVKHTGVVPVYIYNVLTGDILDTFNINAVSGNIINLTIDKLYQSNKQKLHLAVLYDLPTSYYSTALDSGCAGCVGNSHVKVSNFVRSRGVYIDGSVLKANITGESHTNGLSVNYSLQCNHNDWLCQYRNKLIYPVAYKAASEILKYALFTSDRFNSKVVLDYEKIKARIGEYELLYDRELKKIKSTISVPKDMVCFDCKSPIRNRVSLP
jgi:hypothetical protein